MSEKYDTDVTIWSPEGRLHQVKYATEAEKQGSACVGICNKRHVVLGAYRRRANEFADYQQKIMKIDDHIAIAVSGLTADARALASYMRAECMDYEFQFGTKMPVQSLVKNVADKEHFCTITYDRRPYGVGLMVGGRDRKGVHLFHTTAAGNYEEYTVHCIGARSQGARTYFNRLYLDKETGLGHVPEDETPENMIMHVLESLKGCVQNDEELTKENCSIAIVGTEEPYHLLSEEEIQTYLDQIKTNDEKEETMEVDN